MGGALYLHVSALGEADEAHRHAVAESKKIAGVRDGDFNVVKLQRDKVSLLRYEDFSKAAFPALLDAYTVNLNKGSFSITTYRGSNNPPVLHRKELLLPIDDKRRSQFSALTKALEDRGLFDDAHAIGHRRQWDQLLAKSGITVDGAEIDFENKNDLTEAQAAVVLRHKTAISRQGLSTPLQALVRHALLDDDVSVFDYGCGQGDDLATLRAAGITAHGWDPYFFPDAKLKQADIVNLGFVLNVIETPAERVAAAKKAFSLAKKLLTVAVMLPTKGRTDGHRPHNDGFLTSRGTFQKYFAQSEIKYFLEGALKQEAIALFPGVFVIFRDKLAEQSFLANRHRRARDVSHFLTLLEGRAGASGSRDALLINEHGDLLKRLWSEVLKLGRLPDPAELDPVLLDQTRNRLGAIRSAVRLAQTAFDANALKEARTARIDDLRVYFALNLFARRKPYNELPVELQRDIKAFFGNYPNAIGAGKEVLFSVGSPETILAACEFAAGQGLGYLDGQHSLQIDARLVDRLPAPLRVYVSCGEVLYGDVGEADIVKIHIHSGKISLLKFDDYRSSPLPLLRERVKIRLRDQDIEFYEYGEEYPSPPLYFKSRYMASSQREYKQQKKFDDALSEIRSIDLSRFGPSIQELRLALKAAKKRIEGFTVVDAIH